MIIYISMNIYEYIVIYIYVCIYIIYIYMVSSSGVYPSVFAWLSLPRIAELPWPGNLLNAMRREAETRGAPAASGGIRPAEEVSPETDRRGEKGTKSELDFNISYKWSIPISSIIPIL